MEAASDVAYAEFCSGIEQSEPGAALPEAELSAEEMPEPLLTASEDGQESPAREEMAALNTSQAARSARSARGQRLAGELQSAEHNLADVTNTLAHTITSRRRRCASSDPGCLCLRLPPRSDAIWRTDLRM